MKNRELYFRSPNPVSVLKSNKVSYKDSLDTYPNIYYGNKMTIYNVSLNSDMGHLLINYETIPSTQPPATIDFTDVNYHHNMYNKIPSYIDNFVTSKVKAYVKYYTDAATKRATYHVLNPDLNLQDKWTYCCDNDVVNIDYSKLYKYNSWTMVPR